MANRQTDEAKLIDKLRSIEALFAGATTAGEKVAAERAKGRILERLKLREEEDPPVEYRFSMVDMWSRKVFVALLRRYEIRPYRFSGQRYTTVMAKVPKRFVEETLWPEFQEISETLRSYLSGVTDRVVHQVIHQDSSEAEVIEPQQLPMGIRATGAAVDSTNLSSTPNGGQQGRSAGQQPKGDDVKGDGSKGPTKNKRKKRKKRKRR